MSLNQEMHSGDIGTVLQLTLRDGHNRVQITGSDTVKVYLRVNDGIIIERMTTLFTDGTYGTVYYVLQSGDVMESGTLYYQARMTSATTSFSSEIKSLPVRGNIESL